MWAERDDTKAFGLRNRKHRLAIRTSGKKKQKQKPPANAGDMRDAGWIPGSGRSLRGGHGNPLLPGEFHGRRSLVSNSPWVCKDSNTAEAS